MGPARKLLTLTIAAVATAAALGSPKYGLHDDAKYVVVFDSLGRSCCQSWWDYSGELLQGAVRSRGEREPCPGTPSALQATSSVSPASRRPI